MPSMSEFVERVEGLSKVELDAEALRLVRVTQRHTAQLLAHLAEIDRRDVALERGYSSLFAYCTDRLGMSEPQAWLRVQVARVCRKYPAVLDALAANRMSLTVAGRIAPHLTESNVAEVISDCAGMSKRRVVEYVTRFKPKPLVSSGARRVPEPAQPIVASRSEPSSDSPAPEAAATGTVNRDAKPERSAEDVGAHPQPAVDQPTIEPGPSRKPNPTRVEPARPGWFCLRFPANQALMDKIDRLGEVLGVHATRQLEDLVEVAVDLALEKKDPKQKHERRLKRLAKKEQAKEAGEPRVEAESPSAELPESDAAESAETRDESTWPAKTPQSTSETTTRAIPADVRGRVFDQAGYQCQFIGPDGTRCDRRTHLEVDHVHPFAKAGHSPIGPHDETNLRCLCRAHNQWHARRHYGAEFMRERVQRA